MTLKQEANCCQANGGGNCCQNSREEVLEPVGCYGDGFQQALLSTFISDISFCFQEPPQLFDESEFVPLDPTQELIFPPELIVSGFDWSSFGGLLML